MSRVSYSPGSSGSALTIRPQTGFTFTVNITGGAVTSDAAGTSTVTFPQTVSAATTYYSPDNSGLTVSCIWNGVECANGAGSTFAWLPKDGQVATIIPAPTEAQGEASDSAAYMALGPKPSGDGTGVTDRTALQALIDAMPASGGSILLQPCNGLGVGYVLDQALAVNKPVKISGFGGAPLNDAGTTPMQTVTTIQFASRTATCLSVTAKGCTFEDFAVVNTSPLAPTAGAGMALSSPGVFLMRGVTISGFYNNLTVDNGWFYKIDSCLFADPVNYSTLLTATNAAYQDHADFGFTNCTWTMFNRQTDAAAAVRIEGGSGGRFIGCKVNGQTEPGSVGLGTTGTHLVCLDLAPADGVALGEFEWIGGGISNAKTATVRIAPKNTTGTFTKFTLTGAVLQAFGGANTAVGISAIGGAADLVVSGNQFYGFGGGSLVAQGITGLHIGPNMHEGCTGPLIHISGSPGDAGGTSTKSITIGVQSLGAASGVLPTDQTILQDDRNVISSNNSNGGATDLKYTLPFSCTVVGTWVTICSFKTVAAAGAGHGAGRITVDVDGHSSTVGSAFGAKYERSFNADSVGGAITTATIGADATWGGGAAHHAFRIDTATTPGTALVQVQLVSPGTNISGRLTVDLRGIVPWFAFGVGG